MDNINYIQTMNNIPTAESGSFTTTDGTGTITTISNTANNTLGLLGSYSHYPYQYIYTPVPFLTIDKAENGFIIKKDGKTFIAKTAEEIVKYLK